MPYAFRLVFSGSDTTGIEEMSIINMESKEEFSVRIRFDSWCWLKEVEIQRKPKK